VYGSTENQIKILEEKKLDKKAEKTDSELEDLKQYRRDTRVYFISKIIDSTIKISSFTEWETNEFA